MICVFAVALVIGTSIGIGYGIQRFKESGLIEAQTEELDNLKLKCERIGRNYDYDPIK